jgi:transcription factor TFIIIB component B''
LAEEKVDEPVAEEQVKRPMTEGENKKNDKNAAEEEDSMAMPVPQVKVGPDGQIVLDEKSLVR